MRARRVERWHVAMPAEESNLGSLIQIRTTGLPRENISRRQ
jgi:hypothetical protein